MNDILSNISKSLSETLPVMGKGMLGILIVTFVIILCVSLMNKIFSKKG